MADDNEVLSALESMPVPDFQWKFDALSLGDVMRMEVYMISTTSGKMPTRFE